MHQSAFTSENFLCFISFMLSGAAAAAPENTDQYSVIGITPDCKSGALCGCRFKSYLIHHIFPISSAGRATDC